MALDCTLAQVQPVRDIPIGSTSGNQISDVALPACQRRETVAGLSTQALAIGRRNQRRGRCLESAHRCLRGLQRNLSNRLQCGLVTLSRFPAAPLQAGHAPEREVSAPLHGTQSVIRSGRARHEERVSGLSSVTERDKHLTTAKRKRRNICPGRRIWHVLDDAIEFHESNPRIPSRCSKRGSRHGTRR
jgi:hypothetical protein